MPTEIHHFLTADELVSRAEYHHRQEGWLGWAILFMALGVIAGAAATLICVELWIVKGI